MREPSIGRPKPRRHKPTGGIRGIESSAPRSDETPRTFSFWAGWLCYGAGIAAIVLIAAATIERFLIPSHGLWPRLVWVLAGSTFVILWMLQVGPLRADGPKKTRLAGTSSQKDLPPFLRPLWLIKTLVVYVLVGTAALLVIVLVMPGLDMVTYWQAWQIVAIYAFGLTLARAQKVVSWASGHASRGDCGRPRPAVDPTDLRAYLMSFLGRPVIRQQLVRGWRADIPEVGVFGYGTTADLAAVHLVKNLREYIKGHRDGGPDYRYMHKHEWALVELVHISTDDQLRDWFVVSDSPPR